MKGLAGRIPRAFRNHQTPEGYRYREAVVAKLARLGPLPADARPVLKEWGRVVVELELLGHRLEAVRAMQRPRRIELRRLGSEARKLRVQLLMYERRLDELAPAHNGHGDLARRLASEPRA